jgi:7tm Odorant receptor
MYLMASIMQIFNLCYFCQKLNSSSLKVAMKMTTIDMHEVKDKKMRKAINIIMMRAYKGCGLTAWKFAEINMKTFGTVR